MHSRGCQKAVGASIRFAPPGHLGMNKSGTHKPLSRAFGSDLDPRGRGHPTALELEWWRTRGPVHKPRTLNID